MEDLLDRMWEPNKDYLRRLLISMARSTTLPAVHGFLHKNSIYLAHAWQGMMLDLLGRREEALEQYRQALAKPGRAVSNMTVFHLLVDKAFIEQRLKTPFERK